MIMIVMAVVIMMHQMMTMMDGWWVGFQSGVGVIGNGQVSRNAGV